MTEITCAVCGGKAFRNRRGLVLIHTTPATGGQRPSSRFGWATFGDLSGPKYKAAEVCKGYDRGARAC